MTEYVMVPKALLFGIIEAAKESCEDRYSETGERHPDYEKALSDIIESAKPVSAEPVCFAHPEGLQNLKEKSEALIVYKYQSNGCTEPLFRSPQPADELKERDSAALERAVLLENEKEVMLERISEMRKEILLLRSKSYTPQSDSLPDHETFTAEQIRKACKDEIESWSDSELKRFAKIAVDGVRERLIEEQES